MSNKHYKHLMSVNFMGIRDKVKTYGKTKVKSTRGEKKSGKR